MKNNNFRNEDFLNDEEKMRDFKILSKEEFLESYSYLTEEEYNNTYYKYYATKKGEVNMKNYEVQLGRVVDGAKDGEKEYNTPALMIIKTDKYPSIEEIETQFVDIIKSLNCDCVYGITPLENWELEAYKETYDKYPMLEYTPNHLKYGIKVSYSWGDEEEGFYGKYTSKEEAYKAMCELASKEAYVQNEDFDENRSCAVYFNAYSKEIDLHYDCDNTWCYYRIEAIK